MKTRTNLAKFKEISKIHTWKKILKTDNTHSSNVSKVIQWSEKHRMPSARMSSFSHKSEHVLEELKPTPPTDELGWFLESELTF